MTDITIEGLSAGLSGEVKYKLYDQYKDGSLHLVKETDWTNNTILDQGLGYFTTDPTWYNYYVLGSDGSATNITDTQLGSPLSNGSSNQTIGGNIRVNGSSPNWETSIQRTVRFNAGQATGSVAEMGVSSQTSGGNLFCRHVISPAIDKASNQVLDVIWRLTLWPSLIVTPGANVLIGGVNYATENSFYYAQYNGSATFSQLLRNSTSSFWGTYDGAAGAINSTSPAGDAGNTSAGSASFNGAGGSGFRDMGNKWDLNYGITNAGIIKTATGATTFFQRFQTEFTAIDGPNIGGGIPKTTNDELTLNWTVGWGRH
jgi:hypothetical protein